MRVFPIWNWTELDVWRYIQREGIELASTYFAHEREVFRCDGMRLTERGATRADDRLSEAAMEDRKRGGYIGHRRARERVGSTARDLLRFATTATWTTGSPLWSDGCCDTKSVLADQIEAVARAPVDKGLSTPDLLGWPQTGSGGRRHRRCRGRRRATGRRQPGSGTRQPRGRSPTRASVCPVPGPGPSGPKCTSIPNAGRWARP